MRPVKLSRVQRLLRDLSVLEAAHNDLGRRLCLARLVEAGVAEGHGAATVRACRLALRYAPGEAERGRLYLALAPMLVARGHARWGCAAYARAAAAFEQAALPVAQAAAEWNQGLGETTWDRPGARARLRALSTRLARVRGRAGAVDLLLETWLALGHLDLDDGQAASAQVCGEFAERLLDARMHSSASAGSVARARAAGLHGLALAALGRVAEAVPRLERALEGLSPKGSPAERALAARLHEVFARHSIDHGDSRRARVHLRAALSCVGASGDVDGVAAVTDLARLELLLASTHVDPEGRRHRPELARHALRAVNRLVLLDAPPPALVELLGELAQLADDARLSEQVARVLPTAAR